MRALLILLVAGAGLVIGVDVFDPSVYNFYFYVNTHPDLIHAPYYTFDGAKQHWLEFGIAEGRQGCGSFQSAQYLQRYPDLRKAFGSNYTAALWHYLTVGKAEGRLGYVDGGFGGRWTVAVPSAGLYVSASERTAGAIDSVVWGEKEMINAWDHGRELQLAVTTLYGECFNPTEAGGNGDGNGEATSSVLVDVNANGTLLETLSLPAYWMLPGQCKCDKPGCPKAGCYPMPSDPSCSAAINTQRVSNYNITKRVQLAYRGLPGAILYSATVVVPSAWAHAQVEGPTGYMTQEFSTFYTLNLQSGALTVRPNTPCDPTRACGFGYPDPPVFATATGSHAMGVLSHKAPNSYVQFNFNLHNDANNTTKWTLPFVYQNVAAGTVLTFDTIICVGTLSDVAKCLLTLRT